jgi:dethiobiotin synthetase
VARQGLFVTSTGTSSGKTFVARAIARALLRRDRRVAALKPIETGCSPLAADALSLAAAAGHPELAEAPVFYRAALPLAPYAVQLMTGQPGPDLVAIAGHVHDLEAQHDHVIVEGAGGLLVPLDRSNTMAELARRLLYPLLIVAPDRLGVLSHVIATHESARSRGLDVCAIALTQLEREPSEVSHATNASVLTERLAVPVLHFPYVEDDDDLLAAAAISCGLMQALGFAD